MVALLCRRHTCRSCLLLFLLLCLAGASSQVPIVGRNCTAFPCLAPSAVDVNAEPERTHGSINLTDSSNGNLKTSLKRSMVAEVVYRRLQRPQKRLGYWGGYVPIRASELLNDGDFFSSSNESRELPSFATVSPALPRSSSALSSSFSNGVKAFDRFWCIARPWANQDMLQAALDWSCGIGGSDCTLIQLAQPCYVPNNLISHASFAFNSYFQIHQQATGTCDFAGTAMITNEDPSYPGCNYPFRIGQVGAPIISESDPRQVMAMAWQVLTVSVLILLCC